MIDLLLPVSGRERSQIDSAATFMEQGFDSLSLTQVAFAIRKEFSAKVSFSQLMNQWPNVDMLAAHLDSTLPGDVMADNVSSQAKSATSAAKAAEIERLDRSGEPLRHPNSRATSTATTSSDAAPNFSATGEAVPYPKAGHETSARGSALEEVVAEQARTIARLVTLLEKSGVSHPDAGASAAAELRSARRGETPVPTRAREVETTVPQRGIFSSSRLSERLSASYNESMTLRFTGNISIEKMTRAMERLVERHDALRASFDETGMTMKIASALKIAMPVSDLSSIQEPDRQEERLRKLLADETALPFPLPAGPLFRSQMVLLGPDRAAVVFTAHHIICDGWSLDVLIHDLCAFYSEEISGAPAHLEPAQSYADYAQGVTERDRSGEFKEAGAYWHEKFKDGFPALVLPPDRPRSARREFTARRLDRRIAAPVVQQLRALAARKNCGFFAVLLSSLAIFLARVSRQRRFVIALPTAEQPSIGQPGLAGHCVNLLPFAVELREGEAAGTFLERVQSELVEAQDHAIFTMVSLLEDLHPSAPALGISPISTGLTNVKKFKPHELPQSGFTVDYKANPKSFESFEFYLNAVEVEEDLELHCHYDIKLFEDVTIREWLSTLVSIFEALAADPAREALDLAGIKRGEASSAPEIIYRQSASRESALEPLPAVSTSASEPPRQFSDSTASSARLMTRAEPELLEALIPIWQRVLNVRKLGPDDDFFALGGHSVAAAQLFAMIERELGCAAPLAVLYDASTPRMLAHRLCQGGKTEDWKSLVAIQRPENRGSGGRPPLFLVHAAEGNVLLYRSLAAHLGADQPVYGLQSAGLDGRSQVDGRFEHVAHRYIDEIRQVQAHGPYMLGGYCLGGTLALEMARQLIESGETVGLIALIEIYNVRALRWPLPLHQRFVNRFVLNPFYHLQNVFAAEGAGKLAFFAEKLRVEATRSKASARLGWAHLRHLLAPDGAATAPQAKLADIYEEALAQYEVRPYPGELTVFLAKRHLAGFHIPLGGWGKVAQGGVQLFSLSISPRGSLVEPYVGQLAVLLRGCLDRAMENPGTSAHEPGLELVNTI
ncbi:MAG: condensation domain-containing protein [Terriglobales bacterium]